MAYNQDLFHKVRDTLIDLGIDNVEEKKMFGGMAFLVNHKMCINISDDKLMVRFDPEQQEEIQEKPGFEPMIMKSKFMKGYGYISEDGYLNKRDFLFWINLCLEFNPKAKASK